MEAQEIPLWQQPVTYGAVGGTKAADLMTYPPTGFRPFERRSRIGHGDQRWEFAWQQLMTWGIQSRSGFLVEQDNSPGEANVGDIASGTARRDRGQRIRTVDNEVIYGSQGETSIAPGDTVILKIGVGPFRVSAPCRVIWVVDEPTRKGFAYGTLQGHPECGEEAFIVEQTEDDSVWLTVRAFSRPGVWWTWALYPLTRLVQYLVNRRYFFSLAGPMV